MNYSDPERWAQTIAENRDRAIEVKLRYGPGIVWEYTTEPGKAARKTADMARVPMMVHITIVHCRCGSRLSAENRTFPPSLPNAKVRP